MAYRIAFLGNNSHATRLFFREFAEANREQIHLCDLANGRIVLKDGTEIWRAQATPDWVRGRRFDQVIIAGTLFERNACNALVALECQAATSIVPEEFRNQWYDPDAPEKGETCESCL